jgi:YceI-like domain
MLPKNSQLFFAVLCAAIFLLSCGAPRPRPTPPPQRPLPAALPEAAGARYQIDPLASELRLLVYRGGPMARLGHNHVIVNRALRGSVSLATVLKDCSFSFTMPVAESVVDDPDARTQEGGDFPGVIDDAAKSGTLRNMLSERLLDADRYPTLGVRSVTIAGSDSVPQATVVLTVKDHETTLTLPFSLERHDDRLIATGSTKLRQSVLGLSPLSIMLGALTVEDEFQVKFRIVALR